MQIGFIAPYAGSSVPTGWLACDGSSLLRSSYPTLFTAIGTTYGAVDGTHFNLPDCRNRMVIGAGSTYSLAATGGAASKTLSVAEMPAHTHDVSLLCDGENAGESSPEDHYMGTSGTAIYSAAFGEGPSVMALQEDRALTTGGGSSFSILNPYIAFTWCIAAEIPN